MASQSGPLVDRIREYPICHDAERAGVRFADLQAAASGADASLIEIPEVAALLRGLFGASQFLSDLVLRDPPRLAAFLRSAPESTMGALGAALAQDVAEAGDDDAVMTRLRRHKSDVALLTALADLGGVWPVMTVTEALSRAADDAVAQAVAYMFRRAVDRGEILGTDPETADRQSGYFVLAMGKHGARELNYSSDIDLIVFYEPDRLQLRSDLEEQTFFVRLTRQLVKLIQERTAHGYVFRVDLRLRPDAGATPVAISTPAAMNYYETVGQNWERAALIKARVIAGDLEAGERFLKDLRPFIWRKYLDFAAIADIHAMKRQIHAFRGFGEIGVAGHDIKVGRGGIREIEFFAQTQQLIAGGRQLDLRTPRTLDALDQLVTREWVPAAVRDELAEAYLFLRRIEHRLQMIADEQTQAIPDDPAELARVAHFSGFETVEEFAKSVTSRLTIVQRHYAELFESSPDLTSGADNMVFAGATDDPATIESLARLGFAQPPQVIATVRAWHHGRYAAIRTPRARELLTEVQPRLIEALSKTSDPDLAFLSFDRFLSALPSGVQLFSLLKQNPELLELIAAIVGTAPRLSRILARHRRVLDAVLDPGFFGALPPDGHLTRLISSELDAIEGYEAFLDHVRVIGSEQIFLVGVRVLAGTVTARRAGEAYTRLAEELIGAVHRRVSQEMIAAHGVIPAGASAIVAMGKLGGGEMTAASDLDLILIYDYAATAQQSDGARPLSPTQYYARLTQRLISALSAQTAEGALYDVDMRLRPSGQKGPVATQLDSFKSYQAQEAWTWEHMALTRARVITGPPSLARRIEETIRDVLTRRRDRAKIAADVRDMRARIAAEKGTDHIWDLKQVRGGLVDVEFIAQYLQLVCAGDNPSILRQNTEGALQALAGAGVLQSGPAQALLAANRRLHSLTQVVRLCIDGQFDPASAPQGLRRLLTQVTALPDFSAVEAELRAGQAEVAALFDDLIS
jgi:glutamate-ammonia-ligase adenylyltransferase